MPSLSTRHGARCLFTILFCVALLRSSLPAQGLTGQISGTILDSSGKLVDKATVTLVNLDTGQKRETNTSESGDFVLPEILSGRYTLTVDRSGFKQFVQKGIVLSANERLSVGSITLELGTVGESIAVEASLAPLQTQSSERSSLLDSRQMQELSLKGRDYLALMQLLPGTVDTAATTREAPGLNTLQGLYFNGTRQGSLNLTLDGVSTMDTGGGTGPYFEPSIDAVAEVKVLTVNSQAEYGRTSGGTINAVIKNGTRNFHGGLYYYFRNEALNANEFFNNRNGLARPRYRYNYPGAFIGGPVLIPGTGFNRNRDKLFFFWSQEYLKRDSPTSVSNQTFPTALERTGDFSQSIGQNGQLISIKDPLSGKPFPGNVVPASRIDASGQGLLNVFPLPNTVDPTHTLNWVGQSIIEHPRLDEVVRIDWNIAPGTQFYARGILDREATQGGFGYTLASPNFEQLALNYQIHSEGLVGTLIHTFSPTRVNELTFGVTRGYATAPPLTAASLEANSRTDLHLNLPQFYPQSNPLGVIPNATFGGVSDAPQLNLDGRFPYFGANSVWEYADNYSELHGAHNLKFGAFVDHASKNSQLLTSFNGTFAFDRDANNPLDTGYAFANALIGSVDSYTESNAHPTAHAHDTSVEWYGEDSWKVARRLTLEAGVRFYWIKPTSTGDSQLASFVPSLYNAAQQPPLVQPYINPATGQRVGRDPVTGALLPVVKIGTFSPAAGTPNAAMRVVTGEILKTPPVQYAPRAGLAWDVFGNGKTAIRSGFGIFYDRFPQNQVTQLQQSPPLINTPVANYTTIASLLSTPLALSPSSVFGIQTDYKPPAVYSWSFEVQQNIGFGTVLSVSYVGDAARHGMQIRNLNATNYGTNFLPSSIDPTLGNKPLPSNFLRPYQGYGDIQYMEFVSNSHYNALQTSLRKRLSSRLTFNLSYTWSKVLNVADTPSSAVNPVLDYNSRNYGPAVFDRRQVLTVNYVYALPSVSKYWSNAASRRLFDGWEISGIASFLSGAPMPINYTFVTATDITGATGAGIDSRVDLSCNPNLSSGDRSFSRAFDQSCVHPPTAAELGIGNASKYPLVGPGVENFDISVFRNVPLGSNETRRLQLRFETYNTLNHAQFTAFDNNARFSATGAQVNLQFGQYTASSPGRRVSIGLKLYF